MLSGEPTLAWFCLDPASYEVVQGTCDDVAGEGGLQATVGL